jgi:hypothetical protein
MRKVTIAIFNISMSSFKKLLNCYIIAQCTQTIDLRLLFCRSSFWHQIEVLFPAKLVGNSFAMMYNIMVPCRGCSGSKNVGARKIARYQILSPVPKSWSQKI